MSARHWAGALIGRGYELVSGCWGLVRQVFLQQLAIALPEVAVGEEEAQGAAILAAFREAGGHQVAAAREFDVLLMRNTEGQRHVGVATPMNGVMGMLHATEVRGVEWIALHDLRLAGYTAIEIWRRA